MPIPQPTLPGAIDPQQALAAAQASLLGGMNPVPGDPTQMMAPSSMDPTQQQISDVEASPIQEAHNHYVRSRGGGGASSMVARRQTAHTPFAQHIQQSNVQNTGNYRNHSAYENQGMAQNENGVAGGIGEYQNLPQMTAQDLQAVHPDEDFHLPQTGQSTEETAPAATPDTMPTDEEGNFQVVPDKGAAAYQASLQGISAGKRQSNPETTAKFLVNEDDKQLKAASKPNILGGGVADPEKVDQLEADRNTQMQKLGARTTSIKAKPGHTEGQILRDPTSGKTYMVQNGQYVEQ